MFPGVWRHGDWIRITAARHRGHLRPLGLDDQPRRRPHGDERDLPRGARARRDRRRARGRRPAGRRGELDAAVRRAARRRRARRRPRRRGRASAIREDCSPRHVPSEVRAIAEVPRTLSGKVLEVPVKRILMRRGAGASREPRVARQPAGARHVRRARARARLERRRERPRERLRRARAAPRRRAARPARRAAPAARRRPPPRATGGGGCGPARRGRSAARSGGPAAARGAGGRGARRARRAAARRRPRAAGRRRARHTRRARPSTAAASSAPSPRRATPSSQAAATAASSTTVGTSWTAPSSVPSAPATRAAHAAATSSAAATSHQSPPRTRASRCAQPRRGTSVRAASSRSTCPPGAGPASTTWVARRGSSSRSGDGAVGGLEREADRADRRRDQARDGCAERHQSGDRGQRRGERDPGRVLRPDPVRLDPRLVTGGAQRVVAGRPRTAARRRCRRGGAPSRRTIGCRRVDAADLAFAGLARQAELVRAGEVSSRELTELYLDRIARLDPRLNAYRVVLAEEALANADAADRRRGDDAPPLNGVPIAIKDDTDVEGQVTAHGSLAHDFVPAADAEVVRAPARGRHGDPRQDERARARGAADDGVARVRRDLQPVGPGPHERRLERRLRHRGRRRALRRGARDRRRRLDPDPGRGLRPRRAQAAARPRADGQQLVRHGGLRRADPRRPRHGAVPRRGQGHRAGVRGRGAARCAADRLLGGDAARRDRPARDRAARRRPRDGRAPARPRPPRRGARSRLRQHRSERRHALPRGGQRRRRGHAPSRAAGPLDARPRWARRQDPRPARAARPRAGGGRPREA